MRSITFYHPDPQDADPGAFLAASLHTEASDLSKDFYFFVHGPFEPPSDGNRDYWNVRVNGFADQKPYHSLRSAVKAAHEMAVSTISALNWGFEGEDDELPW